jgi:hypothetical protein
LTPTREDSGWRHLPARRERHRIADHLRGREFEPVHRLRVADQLAAIERPHPNLAGRAPPQDVGLAGNDILISGTGVDVMWGDAQTIDGVPASPSAPTGNVTTGADTFVFAPGNGSDYIYDFRQSDGDRIDVSAYGFHSMADLTVLGFGGPDTYIALDASNSLTLIGISDINLLHESDFIFA